MTIKVVNNDVLEIFIVDADPETGEWLGDPESTGTETFFQDWITRRDTDAEHYDTYVHDPDTQAERALIVRWID